MTNRTDQLQSWVSKQLGDQVKLHIVKGDASFRHYYRVVYRDMTYIAVDAPPDKEDNEAFVAISLMLQRQGLNVPEILSYDYENGFLLLSDLGDTLLLEVLDQNNAKDWYLRVYHALRQIQLTPIPTSFEIPPFDEKHIRLELSYFNDWCLDKLLGLSLSKAEAQVLEQLYKKMVEVFSNQPQVLTHRDFHSRNIMILPSGELGIIDYQDAMVAPITYDLVSLLKDCYIKFSPEFVQVLCQDYYAILEREGLIQAKPAEFMAWFDWVGLQRHLKVLGIFSRLKLRDNKQGYLEDTPRIIQYIKELTPHYEQMAAFESLLFEKILPAFKEVWQKEGISQVA